MKTVVSRSITIPYPPYLTIEAFADITELPIKITANAIELAFSLNFIRLPP